MLRVSPRAVSHHHAPRHGTVPARRRVGSLSTVRAAWPAQRHHRAVTSSSQEEMFAAAGNSFAHRLVRRTEHAQASPLDGHHPANRQVMRTWLVREPHSPGPDHRSPKTPPEALHSEGQQCCRADQDCVVCSPHGSDDNCVLQIVLSIRLRFARNARKNLSPVPGS